jgi:hypothetical protein
MDPVAVVSDQDGAHELEELRMKVQDLEARLEALEALIWGHRHGEGDGAPYHPI